MTSQTSKASSKQQAAAKTAPAPSRAEQARSVVESAVDLQVGAVLEVSDRVSDLVEPFSDRSAAQKQLRSYRTRLRRAVKRTERRGAGARRKATVEARKTRSRAERRVREALEEQTSRAQQLVEEVGDQLAALR